MSATSTPTERDRFWLDHEAAIKASGTTESPRDCRRLHFLRGWGHVEENEVFQRSPRTGGSDAGRSRARTGSVGVIEMACGEGCGRQPRETCPLAKPLV